jgi:hypothetical protein
MAWLKIGTIPRMTSWKGWMPVTSTKIFPPILKSCRRSNYQNLQRSLWSEIRGGMAYGRGRRSILQPFEQIRHFDLQRLRQQEQAHQWGKDDYRAVLTGLEGRHGKELLPSEIKNSGYMEGVGRLVIGPSELRMDSADKNTEGMRRSLGCSCSRQQPGTHPPHQPR